LLRFLAPITGGAATIPRFVTVFADPQKTRIVSGWDAIYGRTRSMESECVAWRANRVHESMRPP
jgi:hypothetical protein